LKNHHTHTPVTSLSHAHNVYTYPHTPHATHLHHQ
jgi:hypothetical protein